MLRAFSRCAGWLDRPDGMRKTHLVAVPPCGGSAVFLGLIAGQLFFPAVFMSFWCAAAIILATGIADDRLDLRPWQKLIPQAIAAGIVVAGSSQQLSPFAAAGAVLWLVLCANAFNLLDGLDGLAAAAGLIAAVAMAFLRPAAASLLLPLAGSLAAFLIFNLPPASVFLGDSGSLLVGFVLGWAVLCGGPGHGLLGPALILAVPLGDTTITLAGRLLRGKPIFRPDREHLHHRLLRYVASPPRALFWLSAASLALALAGIAISSAAPKLP
jgi:UDP-GlcNAc:undecaprenyl-phosphate GlcNAc-1-phosphate transferase